MDEPITTPTVTAPSPSITVMDNPAEEQIEVRTDSDSGGSLLDNTTDNNGDASVEEGNTGSDATSKPEDTTLEEDIAKHDKLTASIEKDLKNRGYDIKRAIREYEETGDISTRTLADLAAAGYPKELVESILSSQKALEERFVNAVYDRAGG